MIAADASYGIRLEIFRAENMKEVLMNEIRSSGSISLIERYEEDLLPTYENEIRDTVVQIIRFDIERASDRKHYRQLVQLLKKLKRYSGGMEIATSIADEWKSKYPRRRAMIDELRKGKF